MLDCCQLPDVHRYPGDDRIDAGSGPGQLLIGQPAEVAIDTRKLVFRHNAGPDLIGDKDRRRTLTAAI